MRGRGKPFVMYRRGPANFIIVPRGVVGWSQFAVWVALLAALAVWFARHVQLHSEAADFSYTLVLFGMGVFIWIVAGLWWMIARAEIVDVAELMRDRQRERRKRRRKQ